MMDAKELLLYLEREKQRKEANEEAQKSTSSKGSSSSKSSQNISNSSIEFEINVGSDDGKSFSSSSSASNSTPSIKDGGSLSVQNNKANLINTQEVKLSETSGSVESIKIIDDGMKAVSSVSSKISSATSQAIPTISNFAIVKFTGADNFGKSAYTVGKKSSERMTTAIEYITRDGVYKEDGSMIIQRADGHIDYMIRDGVQDKGLDSDFRSGILYDKYGDILSIAHAKEMFGKDITGERRLVYSPNSNLKMNDSEFQKAMYRTLSDFGNDYHKNYDYISAIHRNTDNPHAHILMSTKDVGGEGIKMFKDELFELKMRFYENTQQIAENKKNNFEIQYNDKSHYSLAMQIGRFTGDIPGAEFANQNIYLAEKIAKKYNLNFDEKAMQKDTENVKKFFEENKDKYNEFLTNAKNRYADTFTKFSKDASELSEKYNLGAVPKDMDGFKDFLQKNQKLFLADKIATAKDIEITSKDVKNLTLEIKKDDNGELTREGKANIKKSMQWFDKNEAAVKEWNQENKGRMSKELFNRLENLNERVDSQFEMPKDRMGAIALNHHYKIDPMAFANDTRKASIDVVEARVDYFKKEYKGKNLTKDEYKTNLSRLGGLRDRIKAFDDVTVGSLKKYGIDTSFFASHEKTIELDGIKLDDIGASNKFSMLIESELSNERLSDEEKKKLEKVNYVAQKAEQISISALENVGFKREDLEKTFNVEKIEAKLSIVDFRTTEIGKDVGPITLKQWKEENLKNYKYQSTSKDLEQNISVSEPTKSEQIQFTKLSQHEINELKSTTKEMLQTTDPSNVLNALGIDYKTKRNGTEYNFRLRSDDKTPSASVYLAKDGNWKFHDFGSGESGNIVNVVMNATNMNFKDAFNYSLQESGLKNLVEEALEVNKEQNRVQLRQEHQSKLEELKSINLTKSQSNNITTKVVDYRSINTDDKDIIDFLNKRGIENIPQNMFVITGQIDGVKADGSEYSFRNTGVGVLTGDMSQPVDLDNVGADIHFLKPVMKKDGTVMKTQSFGNKDITLIPGQIASKDYAIFESKMDYAAATSKLELDDKNIIIANGIGQSNKIVDMLNENGFDKVTFFNQNDTPGERFVSEIAGKADIEKFDFIKYDASQENKQDINDLVKNGVELNSRIVENGTREQWADYIEANQQMKIDDIKELIESGKIKEAELALKESGLDKEIQEDLKSEIEFAKTIADISKSQEDMEEKEDSLQNEEKTKDTAMQEKAIEEDLTGKKVLVQEEIAIEQEEAKSKDMGMGM